MHTIVFLAAVFYGVLILVLAGICVHLIVSRSAEHTAQLTAAADVVPGGAVKRNSLLMQTNLVFTHNDVLCRVTFTLPGEGAGGVSLIFDSGRGGGRRLFVISKNRYLAFAGLINGCFRRLSHVKSAEGAVLRGFRVYSNEPEWAEYCLGEIGGLLAEYEGRGLILSLTGGRCRLHTPTLPESAAEYKEFIRLGVKLIDELPRLNFGAVGGGLGSSMYTPRQ